MKIIYTPHLEFRIKIRNIPYYLPKKAFKNSREHYYDKATKHYVAIRRMNFKKKSREFALAYDRENNTIKIITIHPIKTYQKYSRIHSGRWIKL